MIKEIATLLFLLFTSISFAQDIPQRIHSDKLVNDYTGTLTDAEQETLEIKLQNYKIQSSREIVIVITKDFVKKDAYNFALRLADDWRIKENGFVIFADIAQAQYGIIARKDIQTIFPEWTILKLEDNYIKPNFRKKKYYAGLNEATDMIIGLLSGTKKYDDLKKDSSGSTMIIIMILTVISFLLIFPILQYRSMQKSHFSSKSMDFVSTVILMNTFSTGGTNAFDNFRQSTGKFTKKPKVTGEKNKTGGGISGSW